MVLQNCYWGFWPLPGGEKKYLEVLTEILVKVRDESPSFDSLASWVSERFGSRVEWTRSSLRATVFNMGLARKNENGICELTEEGRRFLETRDLNLVIECLRNNICGIDEMLSWIGEKPMTVDELYRKFMELKISWKGDSQVRFRLLWLKALKVVGESDGRYYLILGGKETVEEVKGVEGEARKEVQGESEGFSHNRIVSMICEIGEILDFHVKREEWTPDRAYRCDVTWRDYETHHSPLKVFEIELSGNVDHALSSLSHAYDSWRPEQLYLVIEDESDSERARKLIEPRIKGAFARISGRLRIITWRDIYRLYSNLDKDRQLLKEIAKRVD
jgi:hypothetical protein